jgi:CopG antitoxin of type II toxin-antitoxin system
MEGRYTTMSDQSAYQGPAYPTEAHGSIPAFNTYEEEATFWDTHSITDLKAETETVKVSATRGLSANVQVRFDPETDHELEAIARERGMKKATLIRTWVLERLRQDRNRHAS